MPPRAAALRGPLRAPVQTLARLHRRKHELLRVLDRLEIPLHRSENDIRAFVTKRKISGGTVSEAGKNARDVLLGLMKTCIKLDISFSAISAAASAYTHNRRFHRSRISLGKPLKPDCPEICPGYRRL
ncbi:MULTISPECIES: hypothetical protein [Mesorhizobium]|uniref:hypothetical protein n=1 Tax=Mesorhizobium TaxID=68287 RepID=UPI001459FE66|nr:MULTISPECIES: hypothetical protein [Mesorhizobium]